MRQHLLCKLKDVLSNIWNLLGKYPMTSGCLVFLFLIDNADGAVPVNGDNDIAWWRSLLAVMRSTGSLDILDIRIRLEIPDSVIVDAGLFSKYRNSFRFKV